MPIWSAISRLSTCLLVFTFFLALPLSAQTKVYLRYGGPFTRKAITAVQVGAPAVLTSNKHGFANGDMIAVQAVSGMPSLNGIWVVQSATENTFQLADLQGKPAEARGVWENKGWAGRVRETTLSAHPRGLLDGPNGDLTARVKDPDGRGGQKAPAARAGWIPWDSMMRRYEPLAKTPEASLQRSDVTGGHGIFGTALAWYADNSLSTFRDAAKHWLNNLERSLAYTNESAYFGSCREDSLFCGTITGAVHLWMGFYLAEAAQGYSILRDEMSEPERKALADKIFNGVWDESCINRLKMGPGTVESVKGSNVLKGQGAEFTKLANPVGRWIQLKDGFKPYESWYQIVKVDSDGELTLSKPANVSISSAVWFWEDDWTSRTCGAIWKMGHHTSMTNVAARIGATTLQTAASADDTTVNVNNPWAFPQAIPFHIRVGSEWMRVTARSGNALTVDRGQFFTNRVALRAGSPVSSAHLPVGGSQVLLSYRAPFDFPDFDSVLDNKNHVYLYSLLMIGIAFADDDPRARAIFEATWNWWHDFAAYDQMALGTGITRGGFSYFPFWTAYSHEIAALARNSLVPAIDISQGNWLRKSQLYPMYGSLPWAPRETVMFADSGVSPGMPLRHFRYFPIGYDLFPETGESRYGAFFYRNVMNYWSIPLMGASSQGFDAAPRWLIYTPPGSACPSADCVDYRTLDPFHFFTETDNKGEVQPANAYNVVVSKQDWTPSATMVWMSALGNPGDHLGSYATPGAYRIGKAGVWLHASGRYTLDTTQAINGSYVEVESPTAIALPASLRKNTLGTLGPIYSVDQKLGNASAVAWRVNGSHAFQPGAAVKQHLRYFAHFKGERDYLVVYDNVETSAEKQKLRRVFCYTHDLAPNALTNIYSRTGADITCSRPEATLLTRVLLPAEPDAITDDISSPVSRVTLLNPGKTLGSEFLVVHHAFAGTGGSLPPSATVSSSKGAFRGLWLDDATPRLALFSRTQAPQSEVAFTSPFPREGQVVVAGLNPGKYSVFVNGAPLPGEFIVNVGQGILIFRAPGGQISVVQSGALAALAILPGAPPQSVIGQPYNYQLQAVGGVPPYVWSLVSGNLPVGLRLDASGVIAGVPERVEDTAFEVRVTDNSVPQDARSASLTLTVVNPPPETLSIFLDTILPTAVGLRYGRPALASQVSCNVTLSLDPEFNLIVDDFFDSGGPPFRELAFGWDIPLQPATQYFLRARCGDDLALSEFETAPPEGDVTALRRPANPAHR